jgi:hypothetical protein
MEARIVLPEAEDAEEVLAESMVSSTPVVTMFSM